MSAAQEITQSRYFGGEAPVERARRIAPIIAASANQIERDRALPKELLDALHGAALFRTLERTVRQTGNRQIIRVKRNINDPEFTAAIVSAFRPLLGRAGGRRRVAR